MEFFWIFFSLVLALALYIMGTTLYLSATSTMQTNLPPMQVTPATLQGTSAPVAFCPKCGTAYAQGAAFCAKCGSPKAVRQTWQLPIKGPSSAFARYSVALCPSSPVSMYWIYGISR